MRVIENKHEGWTLRVDCPHCSSIVEVEGGDVYWERLGSFDEFNTYYSADCGACGGSIDLTKRDLPASVKNKAYKRVAKGAP